MDSFLQRVAEEGSFVHAGEAATPLCPRCYHPSMIAAAIVRDGKCVIVMECVRCKRRIAMPARLVNDTTKS